LSTNEFKKYFESVVHAYNPSTQEAEAGGSQVQGLPGLYREKDPESKTEKLYESRNKIEK
jgi:hypothetical protein